MELMGPRQMPKMIGIKRIRVWGLHLIKVGDGREEVHEPSAWYQQLSCSVEQIPEALAEGVGGS